MPSFAWQCGVGADNGYQPAKMIFPSLPLNTIVGGGVRGPVLVYASRWVQFVLQAGRLPLPKTKLCCSQMEINNMEHEAVFDIPQVGSRASTML